MAYSAEIRAKLRSNYIKGMSLRSAADAVNVPYETSRGWKRKAAAAGDDWDNARAALRVSKSGVASLTAEVIEEFVLLFKSTIDEVKALPQADALKKAQVIAQLSDSYAKTVKAAGDSNPKISSLAVAMEVLKLLAEYIKENHPELLHSFSEILEPFGAKLGQVYG